MLERHLAPISGPSYLNRIRDDLTARWVFAALGIVLLAFSSTWVSFVLLWEDHYSHAFVVAPYVVALLWRRRAELPLQWRAWPLMGAICVAASLAWMLAALTWIQVAHQVMLLVVLSSWTLAIMGRAGLRVMVPVSLVAFLVVPLWMQLAPLLQSITVVVNGVLLAVVRLEAHIEGNYIQIPEGTFEVAAGCSGIAFLMAALTIASIYVTWFRPTRQASRAIFGIFVTLGLITNWLRVFGLILAGHYWGMDHSLVRDHGTYGWVIFAVAQILAFWLTERAERRWPRPPLGAAAPSADPAPAQPISGLDRRWLVVVTLLALTGPMLAAVLTLRPRAAVASLPAGVSGVPFVEVTTSAETQPDSTSTLWIPSGIATQRHWRASLTASGQEVQFDRVAFVNQRQGYEMIGDDRHLGEQYTIMRDEIVGPVGAQRQLVRQALLRKGQQVRLVWYWYRVAGTDTALPLQAKLFEIVALAVGAPPSEFFTVSAPCGATDCAAAGEALTAAVGTALGTPGRTP